jgi:glycerophosphoryl diester phosphodiesterase
VGQLRDRVWVISHRGSSYDAPEHTPAAYELALRDQADFLECDLQLTADGVLVCVHDPTVDRTSDGSGSISDLTLEELRRLDFGSWFNDVRPDRANPDYVGQRIVTFEEQLAYRRAAPEVRFHVETKWVVGPDGRDVRHGRMEAELVRVLEHHQLLDPDPVSSRVVVQSFHPESLDLINELTDDGVPTALLTLGPGPTDVPAGMDVVAPNHLTLLHMPGYIASMHDQGVEVHTWTVDDPDIMRRLIEAGIDGIFSNRPGVLRRLLVEEYPSLDYVASASGSI